MVLQLLEASLGESVFFLPPRECTELLSTLRLGRKWSGGGGRWSPCREHTQEGAALLRG